MQYRDLREFISGLEVLGELKRVKTAVSPRLEMTEICDRVLRQAGPALLFERPSGYDMPVLASDKVPESSKPAGALPLPPPPPPPPQAASHSGRSREQ